ncbi:MAG: hypothetical protein QM651_02225 [Rhodoblastus sp.]
MINETIALLGRKGEDKITGFKGVVTSVCFDLYGCVQLALNPPIDDKGVVPDGRWFDVNRIAISGEPVMHAPDFSARAIKPSDYDRGPAEKPAFSSLPPKA